MKQGLGSGLCLESFGISVSSTPSYRAEHLQTDVSCSYDRLHGSCCLTMDCIGVKLSLGF